MCVCVCVCVLRGRDTHREHDNHLSSRRCRGPWKVEVIRSKRTVPETHFGLFLIGFFCEMISSWEEVGSGHKRQGRGGGGGEDAPPALASCGRCLLTMYT